MNEPFIHLCNWCWRPMFEHQLIQPIPKRGQESRFGGGRCVDVAGCNAARAALQAAQLSDLRKAFEIATAEIRYLNTVVEKQGEVLHRQHNNFRAMKGLPAEARRRGGSYEQLGLSIYRQSHLAKVKGWYFP